MKIRRLAITFEKIPQIFGRYRGMIQKMRVGHSTVRSLKLVRYRDCKIEANSRNTS